ncbi:tRNA-(ms[2]io[6]A)-hydroxylase [Pseudomaricurvus alkylphenolicus]|jgi:tRNA-(ms[2]io[6]A)-hydroxylase|uniref:tRNA-(ms[2]io[6]A)-hydroxylase n=1 Tax=Pseudomaricurvus alkylphenolicus TaxID=1306991 RepID=UPI0014240242|nr:tRNA-(ms[2]io[6]A)-hydroxylase [Pseudomaricurvus alkylphenolicus]NIB42030.1 tRNA-(ms[2]io[6]A)-hydroxylase [Pseudomaricurvus alkylphenolicus]
MYSLRHATSDLWTQTVINNMDDFLIDHAAAEKKASGMAISMLSHYPDRTRLVKAMIDLSIEEMTHFREVVKIMTERGLQLAADEKDPYINEFRKAMRKGSEPYFLDRLLTAGIIEARGCERFGLVGEALPAGQLQDFYRLIAKSEAKHNTLFIDLAGLYFSENQIAERMDQLLDLEADIVSKLPIRAALH